MTARRERIAAAIKKSHLHGIVTHRPWWKGLLVLNYHRIGDPLASLLSRIVFSGTAEMLDRQIRTIQRKAEIIAPRDVPAVLADRRSRGQYVLLTFDDGYRDNYDLAFPVLRANGVSASFFLSTGFIDSPSLTWGDELSWMIRSGTKHELPASRWIPETLSLHPEAIEAAVMRALNTYPRLKENEAETTAFLEHVATSTGAGRAPSELASDLWLTWDMAREMHRAGMELGGHTVTHPALAEISVIDQAAEIAGCRDRLIAEIGQAPTSFAYPFGGKHQFTAETAASLKEHGFSHAFSFYGGYNRPGSTDLYDVKRIYMAPDTTDSFVEGAMSLPRVYAAVPPKLPWKRGG